MKEPYWPQSAEKCSRFVCIHGHFYQPPRENPWLEYLELQESAYPFHDWNARITAECYGPNAKARILDDRGRVVKIINNYEHISFNFGPTLLSWMEGEAPGIYRAILDADRRSMERFGGHGSAIAQVYNHTILPLASRRDKETQVRWGLRDFERRFGRAPEAMWLAETACDLETLEVLADHGLSYVILAPGQARAVRQKDADWQHLDGRPIDTREPYGILLPGGKDIAAFFYAGDIAQDIAFGGLLHDGRRFAASLISHFDPRDSQGERPQLVNVATDGETYGHHHRHGEMALAYVIDWVEKNPEVRLTNYGEYLAKFPPESEVALHEVSSWSCAHGVGRWSRDCGCTMTSGFHQKWRAPLRAAFDSLRDELDPKLKTLTRELADTDLGEARDAYIDLVIDRARPKDPAGPASTGRRRFLERFFGERPSPGPATRFIKGLELARQLQLMYTSCAWFFDDISGLEVVQNLKYALRAIDLARDLFDEDLLPGFLDLLEKTESNLADVETGRQVFEKGVAPASVSLEKVAAHLAVSSVFEDYGARTDVYSYRVNLRDFERRESGRTTLAVGRALVSSKITGERKHMMFGVIHLGDHNINAGVLSMSDLGEYSSLKENLLAVFAEGDLAGTIRTLDHHFGKSLYSIKDLFLDHRARILERILKDSRDEVESSFRLFYKNYHPLMTYLSQLDTPVPRVFRSIAQFVENTEAESALDAPRPDAERIGQVIDESRRLKIALDEETIGYKLVWAILRTMNLIEGSPLDTDLRGDLLKMVRVAREMSHEVDLGPVQERFYGWDLRARTDGLILHAHDQNLLERFLRDLGEELRTVPPSTDPSLRSG